MKKSYKSFAFQFLPTSLVRLNSDIYAKMDIIIQEERPFWLHFEKPSKNLQQQLGRRLMIPKPVRLILFADEVRPRCIKVESGFVLIIQGIQPSNIYSEEDFPTMRFWVTKNKILSMSTGNIQAIPEICKELKQEIDTTFFSSLPLILGHLIWSLEDSIHYVDEKMYQIESNFEYSDKAAAKIMALRQDIIYLRRYIIPQRDALINLSNKISMVEESTQPLFKELSDNMIRHTESIEMLRERAMIIQDNLNNQIGEITNRRVYVLTIITLIFTPAFFIMGLFSMYLPIPGMNNESTWWMVCVFILVISYGLYKLFKKNKWI